ncbi:hypothetical protein ENBRE01_3259 [Enteropsectra breve]|nr:hypothetical protein ENBRE01_3259 [Enteropsectra breve]
MPVLEGGRNIMFQCPAAAIDELLDRAIIQMYIFCDYCNRQMKVVKNENTTKSVKYVCETRSYRHVKCLFKSHLELNTALYLFYCILNEYSYRQIRRQIRIADSTIIRAKTLLRNAYNIFSGRFPIVLGDPNCIIECDETVLSRRGIIVSPTSTHDHIRDTVWIVGYIDNS